MHVIVAAPPASGRLTTRWRLTLSEELGVAPEPAIGRKLTEPLLFGPMLPPRYRLSGPGAMPEASALLHRQLEASPRAPVDPLDVDALRRFGWSALAAGMAAPDSAAAQAS